MVEGKLLSKWKTFRSLKSQKRENQGRTFPCKKFRSLSEILFYIVFFKLFKIFVEKMNTIGLFVNQMLGTYISIMPIWYLCYISEIDKNDFDGLTEHFAFYLGAVIVVIFVELGNYGVADLGFGFESFVSEKGVL